MLHFPAFVLDLYKTDPGWPGMCTTESQLKYLEIKNVVLSFVISLKRLWHKIQ